ncbi:MAG: hypothetical protein ACPGVU_11600 [Limisphaerales bacterium]
MKPTVDQEFHRLVTVHKPTDAKQSDEIRMIIAADRARDYGIKAWIPFFGLYFGAMAIFNSFFTLAYQQPFPEDHPARSHSSFGLISGMLGFAASWCWVPW